MNIILPSFVRIYQVSIAWGHITTRWTKARIIFIRIPGRARNGSQVLPTYYFHYFLLLSALICVSGLQVNRNCITSSSEVKIGTLWTAGKLTRPLFMIKRGTLTRTIPDLLYRTFYRGGVNEMEYNWINIDKL